ncbi:2347_t:CDS:10 [Cetraspora pellucida]|uniref:2347_t:CDS:1 n=1 Tax=Cetraspora pellucida TaxID=1433469 RepID=A0A9N9BU50_9GLOM|nr:2347_t:CDS:10 [Cetraspora pellucida]
MNGLFAFKGLETMVLFESVALESIGAKVIHRGEFLAELFVKLLCIRSYAVASVRSDDGGIDIICEVATTRFIVQCRPIVDELLGVLTRTKQPKGTIGIIVGPSMDNLTPGAISAALEIAKPSELFTYPIIVTDPDRLLKYMINAVLDKLHESDETDRKQSKESIITDIRQTIGSTYGGNYKLRWVQQPRSVFVVKKPSSESTEKAFVELISWLHDKYPQLNIIIEQETTKEFQNKLPFVYIIPEGQKDEYTRVVDFVVTLGGDGTILHVSSQFDHSVPPIISFSMGTLGFLLPFHIRQYESALESLIKGDVSLLLRMRLMCSMWNAERKRIVWNDKEIGILGNLQAMNEVNLHRGRFPHLTAINCFVDEQFLTNAVADGLITATPTGSTAYSLSAGGPIIHPSVQSILLTPICPRSLSFRPISLPPTAKIKMKISEESRAPLEVTVDGRVEMSPYPIPCVNRVGEGVDWVKDINELLKWNQNFVNKQLLTHWW